MRRIAIASEKGGVGKTTTSVNLAAGLALEGQRVLLVDVDPQGSATRWVGGIVRPDLSDALEGRHDWNRVVHPSVVPNLDLIPASQYLEDTGRTKTPQLERIRRGIETLESTYDTLIFDCPPGSGALLTMALTAAHEIFVTSEPTPLALAGIRGIIRVGGRIRADLNNELHLARIVFCRVQARRKLSQMAFETTNASFPHLPPAHIIRENVRLAEAPKAKQPIQLFAPKSHGAQDYAQLVRAVLREDRIREVGSRTGADGPQAAA
ncbi:MAG: ParA family protein [Candidatus Eisenbacteria bacterium]